eukprot:gnl/MRDRNA2_/MRDRNA2_33670_c0_seq1.p1 gnl/MRDRNA2_/MRDRNA2_33670_c0~~gnl/MRDRNA2_/MRDRNA2_33670_c0_seq1.p1  ORF type:complete len:760 (+),score=135.22 gnl/MRDRNA2_/MRDRNA2_33670_c0_seq1:61-2280(+)
MTASQQEAELIQEISAGASGSTDPDTNVPDFSVTECGEQSKSTTELANPEVASNLAVGNDADTAETSISTTTGSLIAQLQQNQARLPTTVSESIASMVSERIGSSVIVKTPYGDGIITGQREYEGMAYAILDLQRGGSLSVPQEIISQYEVVGNAKSKRTMPSTLPCPQEPNMSEDKMIVEKRSESPDRSPEKNLNGEAHTNERTATSRSRSRRKSEEPELPVKREKLGMPDAMLGEWQKDEEIYAVFRVDGCLQISVPSVKGSFEVVQRGEMWQAKRRGSQEDYVYELTVSSEEDRLHVQCIADGETLSVGKSEKCESILGHWLGVKSSSTFLICERDKGSLSITAKGKPPLMLLRRRTWEWEARKEDNGDAVYRVRHDGNAAETIIITRPGDTENANALEFKRHTPDTEASQGKSRDRTRSRDRRMPRSPRRGPGGLEKDFEEFVRRNNLQEKTALELKKLSESDQRHVMGLDGGRNGFILLGAVRDPDAVVFSRMIKLRNEGTPMQRRGRTRSRSRRWSPSPRPRSGSRRRQRGANGRGPSWNRRRPMRSGQQRGVRRKARTRGRSGSDYSEYSEYDACSAGDAESSRSPSHYGDGPRRRSQVEEDLVEFSRSNGLERRTEDALRQLSDKDLMFVMGTDGGENCFKLKGQVNNPDAVVMSRVKRLKERGRPPPRRRTPPRRTPPRRRSPPRRTPPQRRTPRRSRSKSRPSREPRDKELIEPAWKKRMGKEESRSEP